MTKSLNIKDYETFGTSYMKWMPLNHNNTCEAVRSMTEVKNDSSEIRKMLSLQLENDIYCNCSLFSILFSLDLYYFRLVTIGTIIEQDL